jgi:addiction module HigA family antidote
MPPKNRPPTTPGEMLREEFLVPFEMTQGALAKRIGVTTESINRLVNGKRALSVEMALRLAKALGTTPEFWLNLQRSVEIWNKKRSLEEELSAIETIPKVV